MKKVPLNCDVCGSRNYSVPKQSNLTSRLALKKFCSRCNAHTMHKESK